MKLLIRIAIPFCALFVFATAACAQRSSGGSRNVATVVVSSAAKGTWAVTAFTVKTIAKPVAKAVFLKATPAVTKLALKYAAKETLPIALKLSVL